MPRLTTRTTQDAPPGAQTVLQSIEAELGMVPNLLAIMANSAAVLDAYMGFSSAMRGSSLSDRLREQITLVVSELNRCEYCLAVHTALGRMAGLSDEEIVDGRRGSSPNRSAEAALVFARKLVEGRGLVADDDIKLLRTAGFDDGGITEIVASVALTIFTNYLNHVAETEVDFPTAGLIPRCN